MTKLGVYFMHDMEDKPEPRKLQQCVMFYIIYFFCCRGQEYLHEMTQTTYAVKKDSKGRKYVYQCTDKIDKNHTADDEDETNQGRMYETPGNYLKLLEHRSNRLHERNVTKPKT